MTIMTKLFIALRVLAGLPSLILNKDIDLGTITGWNDIVKEKHRIARTALDWVADGRPRN